MSGVERMCASHAALRDLVSASGDMSLWVDLNAVFVKALIIAAASEFEVSLSKMILEYVVERAARDEAVVSLVKNKVLERQFHTFFQWDGKNVNGFFGLFGSGVRARADEAMRESDFRRAVESFLQIGARRNLLAHNNFAVQELDWSIDDVVERYTHGRRFVEAVPALLRGDGRGGA